MPSMPDPHTIPSFPSEAAQDNARTFAATALVFHGIALLVFAARLWTRLFPVLRMQLDDWVCVIAYVR